MWNSVENDVDDAGDYDDRDDDRAGNVDGGKFWYRDIFRRIWMASLRLTSRFNKRRFLFND